MNITSRCARSSFGAMMRARRGLRRTLSRVCLSMGRHSLIQHKHCLNAQLPGHDSRRRRAKHPRSTRRHRSYGRPPTGTGSQGREQAENSALMKREREPLCDDDAAADDDVLSRRAGGSLAACHPAEPVSSCALSIQPAWEAAAPFPTPEPLNPPRAPRHSLIALSTQCFRASASIS